MPDRRAAGVLLQQVGEHGFQQCRHRDTPSRFPVVSLLAFPQCHDPIGEIYAMGVDPEFASLGFGSAITIAGLAHLRRDGLMSAMLYVDAENLSALRLYMGLGFSEWGRDVMYRLPN